TVPPTPQGRPVVMQAGVSPEGREIAARYADAIFSPFAAGPAAEDFAADMRRRLTAHGRADDALKILPGTGFALGDTHEEALEQAERDRWDQVSPATAVRQIETIWGRRFEGFDAEGALPPVGDVVEGVELSAGRAKVHTDNRAQAAELIERAEAGGLSARAVVIATTTRRSPLVGTASEVAQIIDESVQERRSDGFMIIPSITPTGLDRFVDEVVPELQNRGSYRTEWTGHTLRENLGSTGA
ncbi:MAG: LLM class flavin-dependent oxidoreductase, partial [Microbacterium gubbeenense]